MLNTWQQENYNESSVKKLITSFDDKQNYGINYRLFKLYIKLGIKINFRLLTLYIKLGIKITKINRVLECNQDN